MVPSCWNIMMFFSTKIPIYNVDSTFTFGFQTKIEIRTQSQIDLNKNWTDILCMYLCNFVNTYQLITKHFLISLIVNNLEKSPFVQRFITAKFDSKYNFVEFMFKLFDKMVKKTTFFLNLVTCKKFD